MDEAIFRALNAGAEVPAIAGIAAALSSRWVLVAVLAPIAFVLLRQRRWWAIVSVAVTIGAANHLSAEIIKPIVGRDRPCRALTAVAAPTGCGPGRSFPSAHATNAFALAVVGAPLISFGWWWLPPLAGLVALSRIVLGVHYPSDVVAGAILGAALGATAWWLRRRFVEGDVVE